MAKRIAVSKSALAALPGVRRQVFPSDVKPQLATLVKALPTRGDWLYEIKHDGYRLLIEARNSRIQLLTRRRNDWTDKFPGLTRTLQKLRLQDAILDGEIVVLDSQGRSDFQSLQNALAAGGSGECVLFLFDLLYLHGFDLRSVALSDRKQILRKIIPADIAEVRYGDHLRNQGAALYKQACQAGLEGIIAKQADSRYVSARSKSWLKLKCHRRQEFVIVGYTEPSGSRTGLGALLLGYHDAKGQLQYAGKVGTGFTEQSLSDLQRALAPLEVRTPAVHGAPRSKSTHWLEPKLLAEVEFGEFTADGRLRHPVYKGLRSDKDAKVIRVEKPSDA